MSGIIQIMQKELTRVLLDKKMILSVFLFPVLVMVGVMALSGTLAKQAAEDVETHQSIVYIEHEPEGFGQFLASTGISCEVHTVQDREEVKALILKGEADLWIEFPENFLREVKEYKRGDEIVQVKTYYNPSEEYSSQAYEMISVGVLEEYRQQLLAQRVEDMASITVFTVNSDNPDMVIQDEERAGGKILAMLLPYFVTMLLFAGAMGIGVDMVAGEKERGTMASLLVSPVRRSSIVLGKVFSLMIISGISSVIYVAALVLFMPQMMGSISGEEIGFNVSLKPMQILMLALLLIAVAFLYSAIIVLVSVFAKTVKEASSYITPMYLLILILGLLTMFTTGTPDNFSYAIPVYNISLALQGIITQELTAAQYGMSLGITLGLGILLIVAVAKAFESEKVMAI